MEIFGLTYGYARYGGGGIHPPVVDLLQLRLGDYGEGIQSMVLTAYLRNSYISPKSSLVDSFDRFNAELNKLPRVTYRRARAAVDIDIMSESFNADDDRLLEPTPER